MLDAGGGVGAVPERKAQSQPHHAVPAAQRTCLSQNLPDLHAGRSAARLRFEPRFDLRAIEVPGARTEIETRIAARTTESRDPPLRLTPAVSPAQANPAGKWEVP